MLDASIPLSVKPIEVASPLQSVGQLMQMRGIMTQQLLHQAEIARANQQTEEFKAVAAQRNRDLQSNKLLQGVMMDPANHDALGKGDYSAIWKAGVSPNIANPAIENLQKQAQTAQTLQKGKADILAAGHSLLGQTIAGLDPKDDDVAAQQWNAALPILAQSHPEIAGELQHLAPGPNFRQQLQGIAAANGVARSLYENAAKLEAEQAGTAEKKSVTAKNTAEIPKITAESQVAQQKADLMKQAVARFQADPGSGGALINEAIPPTLDPVANKSHTAAYNAYMEAGDLAGAAGVVEKAAAHAAALSPATRANKVQTATEELQATGPIRTQQEIAKERVLIPMRERAQLQLEIDKAKLAPNGFSAIIDPHARAQAQTQFDAQNKEALTKLQEGNRLQAMIAAAQGGNKAAPGVIPLQELKMFVNRVNRNELDAVSHGAGSLVDRLQGWVGKATEGQPIPPDILRDTAQLGELNKAATLQNYKIGVATLNAAHGTTVPPVDFDKILGSAAPVSSGGTGPKEGDTATNPQTKQKAKFTGGKWVIQP